MEDLALICECEEGRGREGAGKLVLHKRSRGDRKHGGLGPVAFVNAAGSLRTQIGEGIKVDFQKNDEVQSWPRPATTTEIRRVFSSGGLMIARRLSMATDDIDYSTSLHEKNYPVHDLELAAIFHALKIWRHYLYRVPCGVYNDHRSLQHLFKKKDLNLRKCRWLQLLRDYDITILYHLRKANMVAHALRRKDKTMGSLAFIPVEESPLALDI
ncbi:uncharacterized protein [Nicotiana tomentosiformis]|uniref:uncharacterized protein n=1 Tax=Nicotiana tomentosiformis TaxID=4098 RepID=UPI00388CE8F8